MSIADDAVWAPETIDEGDLDQTQLAKDQRAEYGVAKDPQDPDWAPATVDEDDLPDQSVMGKKQRADAALAAPTP